MNSYFSHDSNARNDAKILKARMDLGAIAYAIYFMILERLRDDKDYLSIRNYNIIAFDLRVEPSLVKAVVEDYELFEFTEDNKYFYSNSFLNRMEIKDLKRQKRVEAGKKGAEARWQNDSNAMTMPLKEDGKANGNALNKQWQKMAKESKVKESKEYIYIYSENALLESAFKEFIAFRKKIKAPMTERAIELLKTKLDTLANNDIDKIEILNRSILNNWKSVYALENKRENNSNKQTAPIPEWYNDYEKDLQKTSKKDLSKEEQEKIIKEAKESL